MCLCVCICKYVHVYVYVCMYICTQARAYVCMYSRTCVCMYVSVYMYICICICVCIRMYGEQKHMCLQWCITVCNDIFSKSFFFSTPLFLTFLTSFQAVLFCVLRFAADC